MTMSLANRFGSIWFLLLFIFPLVNALSIPISKDIQLKFLPLIGGPSFLPVHCRVILQENYGFDFVPVNPTSQETLQKLLSLQAVPGDARIFVPKDDSSSLPSIMVTRAQEFCINYTKDLHLIQNNCWFFAYELIDYIQQQEEEE